MELGARIRTAVVAVLIGALAGGCANPFADDPAVEAGPSRELAETPEDISADVADELAERSGGKGERGKGDGGSGGPAGGDEKDGSGSAGGDVQGADGETSTGPGGGASASAQDGTGDHGLRAPAYADLTGVSVQDRGADLRITVAFDGEVPGRLPDDETQGVGVDLFKGNSEESAYQVFVDGGPDGWFAYFSTPGGFKRYPGSFGIGGRVMVFDVPWSAMKMPDALRFSAFCDWTQRTTGVLNLFGEDHAPDRSAAPFSRA